MSLVPIQGDGKHHSEAGAALSFPSLEPGYARGKEDWPWEEHEMALCLWVRKCC